MAHLNKMLTTALIAIIAFTVAYPLNACDTPVFRYALERWPAAPYTILVFHSGPLDEEQQKLIDALEEQTEAPEMPLDLPEEEQTDEQDEYEMYGAAYPVARVITVDVTDPPEGIAEELLERWKEEAADAPQIAVPHPMDYTAEYLLWSGPLNKENAEGLLISPTRREIAKHILTDNAIVWVMMKCGNEELDKKAEETVRTELSTIRERMQEQLDELYSAASDIPWEGEGEPPITTEEERVPEFTVLTVEQDDPKEAFLVGSLLRSEPGEDGLENYRDEPMVFAAFGRGRFYYALVGEGISPEMIEETCYYLMGPCSCQIKDANPGMDVLMNIDWDSALYALIEEDPYDTYNEEGPIVGLGTIADAVELAEDEPAGGAPDQTDSTDAPTDEPPPADDTDTTDDTVEAAADSDEQPENTEETGVASGNVAHALDVLESLEANDPPLEKSDGASAATATDVVCCDDVFDNTKKSTPEADVQDKEADGAVSAHLLRNIGLAAGAVLLIVILASAVITKKS